MWKYGEKNDVMRIGEQTEQNLLMESTLPIDFVEIGPIVKKL
jgi:hypothetical protein